MADSADKKKPMAERIAGLQCKTSFRDIRDGIGRGGTPELTDQELAAALGMVKTAIGPWPVFALETYYGSNLRYERRLRDEWSNMRETADMSRDRRILIRFSAAIAIRQFAGIVHIQSDMAEFSYLMALHPREFRKAVDGVLSWLEQLRETGLEELRKKCRQVRADIDDSKKTA